ncbi:tetratricopeptide repeat protein [Dactylosporangium sp. NPDC051541]|uniref:tetratricopeptide repeat protein n=1 Tax=Dactylosporangium sp. NPDC051541 TaxID=3363977 RepID=UPI003795A257
MAAIRERQGRVDEAVELLRTWGGASVNGRDQLAELLVRQERIAELHEYAATEHHGQAAECLAEYLERLGDVEGAIAVYRRPGDSSSRRVNGLMRLAQLLTRHGRDDEAAEVLLSLAESAGGELDWKVELLCRHYLDQGRALDGLAYLDDLRGRRGGEEWDIFRMRLPLMVGCGRREEAIELVRGHPERDTSYGAGALAELLAGAGRTDEAVAVLQRQESGVASTLAGYLIDLGRVEDAIAVLRGEDRAAGSVAPGVR